MSVTLTISENAYKDLEALAHLRGFENIEQFLEKDAQLGERRKKLARRQELGKKMAELREKICAEQGLMPDSVELIREDRGR